ncbi:MAG: glycosyltransferase family 2 protein [Candidatus Margulisiibacteriota bacterium]|nr:glycosyltransferase family 2 protein [Candidatus Margulisiibacteriota bacterium]
MDKKISIIIRSYNEEKWINACLDAVFKQDYKNFEVILVDNESKDQTILKAEKYPIKILNIKDFLPGKAINLGIEASTGEYIVCLSAHCIPVNEKWLANLLKDFEGDDKIAGVYGRQEPLSFTPDTDKRDLLTVFGLDKKIQLKDSFFHNANSMIRRDIWKKIPFDDKITNIEDRLWAKEVLQAGYKIVYEPEASVYHYHGIHQNQNKERCTNVVRILEGLEKQSGQSARQIDLRSLNVVALIPVKGEIIYLNDRPLLEYTIAAARSSKYIKDVIVSTDSEEYAKLAKDLGASVPFIRDASLSGEMVDLEHVYQYSINKLEEKGLVPDLVVTLEITFPFRSKGLIDELIARQAGEGFDSVIAARAEFGSCWIRDGDQIKRVDQGFIPRQFKDPVYVGIKGLGCVTYPQFLRQGRLLGEKVGVLEIHNPYSAIEVRDKIGQNFAEEIMRNWERIAV